VAGWTLEEQTSDVFLLRCAACLMFALWGLTVFVLVGLLLIFHIYLVIHSQTTHEFLRSRSKRPLSSVPVSKGNHYGAVRTQHGGSCYSKSCRAGVEAFPSRDSAHQFEQRDGGCLTSSLFPYPSLLLPMWQHESSVDAELELMNTEETLQYLRNAL
jgi:hypothetical protein